MIVHMLIMALFCFLLPLGMWFFLLVCKLFPNLKKWLENKAESEMQWKE